MDTVELAASGAFDLDEAVEYATARHLRVKAVVSLDKDFDGHDIPRIDPDDVEL